MPPATHRPLVPRAFVKTWSLLAAVGLCCGPALHGQDIILHSFAGTADGRFPDSTNSLTLSGSTLYGTVPQGGAHSDGAIFSVNTDGSNFTLLRTYAGASTDGADPVGALTISGSQIYGITTGGGTFNGGTAFKMNLDGSGYTAFYNFGGSASTGSFPVGTMTLSSSKYYGMTSLGGTSNLGTIFSMNADGTGYTTLHNFASGADDGSTPRDGTLAISGSTLYGMTFQGGSANKGTLFSINLDGSGFTILHTFLGTGDGSFPLGSLTLVGSKLYGLAGSGGSTVGGIAFSMNLDGSGFTVIHNFGGKNQGTFPNGSLTLFGTKLFGTTANGGTGRDGTVFEMNLDGSGFTTLENFTGATSDGDGPQGDVTLSPDGSQLYGMTMNGGTSDDGTVFSVTVPAPEPVGLGLMACGAVIIAGYHRRR